MRMLLLCFSCSVLGFIVVGDPVYAQADPAPKYKLWFLNHNGMPGWSVVATGNNAKPLHNKGKHDGRVHVHPKSWSTARGLRTTQLFTMTMGSDVPSEEDPDPNPVRYCLYYCMLVGSEEKWVYQGGVYDNYQSLVQQGLDADREMLRPDDQCGSGGGGMPQPTRYPYAGYFAVGREGDALYPARTCCEEESRVRACTPVEKKRHCLLDLIRSRRGCR